MKKQLKKALVNFSQEIDVLKDMKIYITDYYNTSIYLINRRGYYL